MPQFTSTPAFEQKPKPVRFRAARYKDAVANAQKANKNLEGQRKTLAKHIHSKQDELSKLTTMLNTCESELAELNNAKNIQQTALKTLEEQKGQAVKSLEDTQTQEHTAAQAQSSLHSSHIHGNPMLYLYAASSKKKPTPARTNRAEAELTLNTVQEQMELKKAEIEKIQANIGEVEEQIQILKNKQKLLQAEIVEKQKLLEKPIESPHGPQPVSCRA